MQYSIHEDNLIKLTEKLTRIENKCKKYGCTFQYAEVGEEYKEIQHKKEVIAEYGRKAEADTYKSIERFIVIEVTGKAIINNWEFIATLEHTDNGNIIRSYSDMDIPEKYRTCNAHCDHCNTDRYRKDTYLIRNTQSGELKQVGKSCLMDYTNGLSSEMAAAYASYYDEVSRMDGEKSLGGFTRQYFKTNDFLLSANEIVKKIGFVSKQKAEDEGKQTTSSLTIDVMYYPNNKEIAKLIEKIDYNPESEENKTEVNNMLQWLENQKPDSQYINNLQISCKNEYFEMRDCGLLASLPAAYHKAIEKIEKEKAEKENKPSSVFQGKINDKITLTNVIIKCIASYETQYGITHVFKIIDTNNNIYVWKTNKNSVEKQGKTMTNSQGEEYYHMEYIPIESFTSIKGTIKAHNDYNGENQTELTRCKVI